MSGGHTGKEENGQMRSLREREHQIIVISLKGGPTGIPQAVTDEWNNFINTIKPQFGEGNIIAVTLDGADTPMHFYQQMKAKQAP